MLSENPFHVLSIGPSATPEDVEDAYEDALSDGLALPQQLQSARQALLNPKLRLAAEVSYLPDVERRTVEDIQVALRNGDAETLLKIATKLHALPRSNVSAHVYAQRAIGPTQLSELVRLQSEVAPGATAEAINDARHSAGLVKVDAEAVREALRELFDRHYKSILLGLMEPGKGASVISAATDQLLTRGDPDALEELQLLLDAYGRWIDTSLSAIQESMQAADTGIRNSHPNTSGISQLLQQLSEAIELLRPLQIADHAKGRDEPRSRIAYDAIHSLALWLGNEKDDYSSALTLLEGARPHFAMLPRAGAQIAQSIETLIENDAFRSLAPLIEQIADVKANSRDFTSDLAQGGFGSGSRGRSRRLFLALLAAVSTVRTGTAAEVPWRMVQQLAVWLNNDHDEPEAALSLLDGCLSLATECSPSEEILELLRRDKAKVSYLVKQNRLLVLVKRRDIAGALRLIDSLLPDAAEEDAAFLKKTKASLEAQRQKSGGYAIWVIAGLVAFGLWIAASDSSNYRSPPPRITYQPPATSPGTYRAPDLSLPKPPPRFDEHASTEEVPSAGASDRVFSAANIRYCLFQEARLDAVPKPYASDAVARLNELIRDWNARCSAYRYRKVDMEGAKQSLNANVSRLRIESLSIARSLSPSGEQSKPFTHPTIAPNLTTSSKLSSTTPESEPLPRVSALDRGSEEAFRGPETANPPWSSLTSREHTAPAAEQPSCASRLCDLLRVDEARRVQGRLVELGYMSGEGDGQWGSRSRAALRSFRVSNALGDDDAWDLRTQDKLFSVQAKASSIRIDIPTAISAPSRYLPPLGATLSPLNKPDASKIQKRLAELGYYRGSGNGDWGPASRSSLQDFKVAHGLPNDDGWDAETERSLLAKSAVRMNDTAFGTWSAHGGACGTIAPTSRVSISSSTVDLFGKICSVAGVKRTGSRWSYDLLCGNDGRERSSATFSVREGSLYRLGAGDRVPYVRCS